MDLGLLEDDLVVNNLFGCLDRVELLNCVPMLLNLCTRNEDMNSCKLFYHIKPCKSGNSCTKATKYWSQGVLIFRLRDIRRCHS